MHFVRFDLASRDWMAELGQMPGRLVCLSPPWLQFLAESQRGTPVAAVLMDQDRSVGVFAGMIVNRGGIRILGSPFPGWTTPYMGLDLLDGVSRREAMRELVRFAFEDLGCIHLEVMDRHLLVDDLSGLRSAHRMFNTWEVDLLDDDESLIKSFSSTCGRYIRKAARNGLVVEEARDDDFIRDYYDQLTDVFRGQHLVPTYPEARVRQLITNVPREQLLLLRVRTSGGRAVATGIFHAVDGLRAYGWGFASYRDARDQHPNEFMMFHAMNEWRRRGFKILDLGGSGSYKEKYHPRPTPIPWVRVSRYPFIPPLRELARVSVMARQRIRGRLASSGSRAPLPLDGGTA